MKFFKKEYPFPIIAFSGAHPCHDVGKMIAAHCHVGDVTQHGCRFLAHSDAAYQAVCQRAENGVDEAGKGVSKARKLLCKRF